MNDQMLDGLSPGLYAELVMNLVPGAVSLSVRDAHGQALWHHRRDKQVAIDVAAWFPPDAADWQRLDNNVFTRDVGDGLRFYVRAIRGGQDGRQYFFCLLHRVESGELPGPHEDVARKVVDGMSQLISSHYSLNNELNTMTDELIRRYEELNLVYNTDDEVRHFGEGAAALDNIVENCTEYLNVDATALYRIGKERVLMAARAGIPPQRDTALIDELHEETLAWMSANNASLVVNTPEERLDSGLALPDDYCMVACPVRDEVGRVRGALVVLKREPCTEFENGDRNLLQVMADKASKIVRASYDPLTGLMKREGFERAVVTALPDALRRNRDVCLLHVNVDQLQLVNDTFGHSVGDDLLRRIADTLRRQLRGNDRIARLSGDEFGILLRDCSEENAERMARRLCNRVSALECAVGPRRLDVGVSVGVAQIDQALDSVIGAMAAADLACSAAKEQGRGRAYIYRRDDTEMQERRHQMNWVGALQRAIKSDRFELFSQIIEPTKSGKADAHYELLLRMTGEDGEFISPGIFMPVAERYHMMPAIDRWVIEHALRMLGEWWEQGRVAEAIYAINLSGQTLTDQPTLDFLIAQLRSSSVDPRRICFEITETEAITNLTGAQNFIANVKDLGSRFALDDFGAGMTSFTNLRALDVDYLKIDGSFVVDMANDPVSHSMVAAINQVGQTMQLDTVAEFVESAEIRSMLAELGVDFLQGYDIGRPRPLIEQLSELAARDERIA